MNGSNKKEKKEELHGFQGHIFNESQTQNGTL